MYYLADHIETKTESNNGFVYRASADGITPASVEDVLRGRSLYRGPCTPRQSTVEAIASDNLWFSLRAHDTSHVSGTSISSSLDWQDAIRQAEAYSLNGPDVTVHACAVGWSFPECDLGTWSRGRLVRQTHFTA